jgi:hypothetical protein
MNKDICPYCNAWYMDHDHYHLAKECYPEQIKAMNAEIERLQTENWQLRQACGYPIPADKETPQNPFKCGICDARSLPSSDRATNNEQQENDHAAPRD